LFHLYHGNNKNRGYVDRLKIVSGKNGYNPYKDVYINENGLWSFTEEGQRLAPLLQSYFESRKEDE